MFIKPWLRILSIIAVTPILLLLLWKVLIAPRRQSAPSQLEEEVHSALSNPANFVKTHARGGVGVSLAIENAIKLPMVDSVLPGSSAEAAGLKRGDVLLKVNDQSTAGQSLAQVVESIRGIIGGSVTITVQRPGSTNFTFVLQRHSWNSLGQTNIFQTNRVIP